MAQRDTQLLGEILSVQKAILSKMLDTEKKQSLKEKGKEGEEEGKKEEEKKKGDFAEITKELQNLNKKFEKQLESIEGLKSLTNAQTSLQKSMLEQIVKLAKENEEERKLRNADRERARSDESFSVLMAAINNLIGVTDAKLTSLERIGERQISSTTGIQAWVSSSSLTQKSLLQEFMLFKKEYEKELKKEKADAGKEEETKILQSLIEKLDLLVETTSTGLDSLKKVSTVQKDYLLGIGSVSQYAAGISSQFYESFELFKKKYDERALRVDAEKREYLKQKNSNFQFVENLSGIVSSGFDRSADLSIALSKNLGGAIGIIVGLLERIEKNTLGAISSFAGMQNLLTNLSQITAEGFARSESLSVALSRNLGGAMGAVIGKLEKIEKNTLNSSAGFGSLETSVGTLTKRVEFSNEILVSQYETQKEVLKFLKDSGEKDKNENEKIGDFSEITKELQDLNVKGLKKIESLERLRGTFHYSVNIQKEILKQISEINKRDGESAEKAKEADAKSINLGDVSANIKSIEQSLMQSEATLKRIEKKLVGGAAAGGETAKPPQKGMGDTLKGIGQGLVDVGKGIIVLIGGLLALVVVVPLIPLIALGFATLAGLVFGMQYLYNKVASKEFSTNLKEGGLALKTSSGALLKFTLAMIVITPLALLAVPGIIVTGKLIDLTKYMFASLADAKYAKNLKAGAEALRLTGSAVLKFSLAMSVVLPLAIPALLGVIAASKVVDYAITVMKKLGSPEVNKDIKEGTQNLVDTGKALGRFSLMVLLSGAALTIASPALVVIALAVVGVGYIMKFLGSPRFAKDVKEGYQNVRGMGVALGWFGLGILIASVGVSLAVNSGGLVMFGVAAIAMSVLFKFLGSSTFGNEVRRGAVNVRMMGMGLAIFSLALIVTGIAMKLVDWASLGKLALGLAIVGGAFFLIGKVEKHIQKGNEVIKDLWKGMAMFTLAIVGVSLAMMVVPMEGVLKFVASLALVAGIFALIGINAVERRIRDGAGVARTMSGSMAIFTLAVAMSALVMSIVPMMGVVKFVVSLAAVGLAFALLGVNALERRIRDGAGVSRTMAVHMALFTLAIWASVSVINKVGGVIQGIGTIALSLAMMGAAFALIGVNSLERRIRDGAGVSLTMAIHMVIFAGALYVVDMVMDKVGGIKNLLIAAGAIVAFGIAFALVGAFDKTIREGSKAVFFMALGMAAFGGGLFVLMYALQEAAKVSGGDILKGSMIALTAIGVSIAVFFIAGQFKSQIIGGALSIAAIGLGLAVFGLGLTVYLSGLAKIMGVGGEGVMGGTKISGGFFDTVGSMLVGLGLIAVGAVTLVLYGTIFALAGMFEFGIPLMIGAGALAFMAVGLGLAVFSMGLGMYLAVIEKYMGVTRNETGTEISANSFVGGLATMGGAFGYLIGFGAIFALAGAVSPLILLGAGTLALAGLALSTIGEGIDKFLKSVPADVNIGERLKSILGGVKDGFLSLVGADNPGGSFLGSIGGIFKGAATGATLMVAMATAMMIGPVLSSIAQGIGAWANLSQIPAIKGYDKEGQPIFDEGRTVDAEAALENIKEYLPSLIDPFIELSNKANLTSTSKGSVLSFLIGTDMAKTPFELGISAAGGIGKVLSSVAQGVGAWANLQNIPRLKGYDKDGNPIFDDSKTADVEKALDNITNYMPGILQPFIDLGKNSDVLSTGQGSILGLLVGNDFGRTPFQRGISAAADIGKVLSNIAQGVGAWANLENIPMLKGYDKNGNPTYDETKKANLDNALKNINKALSVSGEYSVVAPFIDLANSPAVGAGPGSLLSILIGNDLGRTPFQRGISAAADIGKVLSSIAQGIGAFANLQNIPKIVGYDSKGQPIFSKNETADLNSALENIKTLLGEGDGSIIDPFLRIAENNSSIPSLLSLITGANIGATPFERGITAAGQIGAVLSSIAQGIGAFSSMQGVPKLIGYDKNGQPQFEATAADVPTAVENIRKLFELSGDMSIVQPFIKLGEYISDSKPFSIGGAISRMVTGEYTGSSPVEKGVALALQMGSILSAVASGIGVFANLSAIPVIERYDDNGRPIYGTPIDGTKSVSNFGAVIKDLMLSFADASKKLEDFQGDPEQMTGIGTVIGSILGTIAESLNIFANPDKIKRVKSYDKDGKPIYYEGEGPESFVKLDDVITTIGTVITKVLGALSNPTTLQQIEDLNSSLGDNPALIGDFLKSFTEPSSKFMEIQSKLPDQNLNTLTQSISYATAGLIANIDFALQNAKSLSDLDTVGSNFEDFATSFAAGYADLFEVDKEGGGFYEGVWGTKSGLVGLTNTITTVVAELVKSFVVTNTSEQIKSASDSATILGDGMRVFVKQFKPAFEDLINVDRMGVGLYPDQKDSGLWGAAVSLKYSITSIVDTFVRDNKPEEIQGALTGSEIMKQAITNLDKFPDYMTKFLSANPTKFGDESKVAFSGIEVITTIHPKDAKKRSHLKMFADEILRLAEAADPFTKFTQAFGKMSEDMGVFAENFNLMNPDGIMAFKEWTDSIKILSTANPTTFSSNVITANKAINAAYSSDPATVNAVNAAGAGPNVETKKTAINEQVKGKDVPQKPAIDYNQLAAAVAKAVKSAIGSGDTTGQTMSVRVTNWPEDFG